MKLKTFLTLSVFTLISVNHLPDLLHAQVVHPIKGDTVRVDSQNYISGLLMRTHVDLEKNISIIQAGKKEILIPPNQILRLEVARGRKSDTDKGLKIEALIGGSGSGPDATNGGSGSALSTLSENLPSGNVKTLIFLPESRRYSQEKKKSDRAPVSSSRRKLEFSFVSGTTSRGPAASIEEAMRKDGFDETLPASFLGGPVEHPFSRTGFSGIGAPWSIQVSYSVNQRFGTTLLVSLNPIGTTSGYRSGPDIFLDLDYYSTVFTPLFIYKPGEIMRFGVGPGLFINKIEQKEFGEIIYREQKSRPGVVLSAALAYPQKSRFFVQLEAQYRYVGKSAYGPFKQSYRKISLAQLNGFEANFSHLFIGGGIGIRL